MAQTTGTDKKLLAQRRQARLAAELRSNLKKRKQQARSRAHREHAGDAARENDERSAGLEEREGEVG